MTDLHAQDIARVERKVDELATKIDGLLDAWNTARGMVKFIKTLGSIATAAGAVWLMVTMIFHGNAK